jgi:hypothetical protein
MTTSEALGMTTSEALGRTTSDAPDRQTEISMTNRRPDHQAI